MILNALGRSERIFARKCSIVEGKHHDFIRDNHLMGAGRGKCYGLEYNGNLVATLQLLVTIVMIPFFVTSIQPR